MMGSAFVDGAGSSPAGGFPSLVAALSAAQDDSAGFTFVGREGREDFFSWRSLRVEAENRAAHLRDLGLGKGDRLLLVLPDAVDFVLTFLGAAYAGIVPVPMYAPQSIAGLPAYAATTVGVMNRAGRAYLATTAELEHALRGAVRGVRSLAGVVTAEQLRTLAPAGVSREPESVSPEDLALLQFTSGSSSAPKGVEVTHANLKANATAIVSHGLSAHPDRDMGVSWLPLHHDMGLVGFVLSPVLERIPVTFLPTPMFVRNPTSWLDTIHKRRGTITFAPNFGYALATQRATRQQLAKWDLSCVRVFGCGAEPIHAATMRAFAAKFSACGLKPHALLPSYGMAEATLAISFGGLDETLQIDLVDRSVYESTGQARPGPASSELAFVNCGRTFPQHEVGVFDEHGGRLPDRQVGELWFRGPSVARGYFGDNEASHRTFRSNWLRTGDLGYLVDGNVFVTSRKRDLIIVNGRNYDPQQIEWIAAEVAEVRRGSTAAVGVPGVPSEGVVVLVESRTREAKSVVDKIRGRLCDALGLLVSDVVVVPPGSLPKTTSGKIQRQKARQGYLEKTLWESGPRSR